MRRFSGVGACLQAMSDYLVSQNRLQAGSYPEVVNLALTKPEPFEKWSEEMISELGEERPLRWTVSY
jgi:hypothetical protein